MIHSWLRPLHSGRTESFEKPGLGAQALVAGTVLGCQRGDTEIDQVSVPRACALGTVGEGGRPQNQQLNREEPSSMAAGWMPL